MDTAEVSTTIATHIAPFLPLLINVGKFSSDALSEMIVQNGGQVAYDRARALWSRIYNTYEDDTELNGIAGTVSASPNNQTYLDLFQNVLVQRLQDNPILLDDLLSIWSSPTRIQEVIAEQDSYIENVSQKLSGEGKLSVHAKSGSIISGVVQVINR